MILSQIHLSNSISDKAFLFSKTAVASSPTTYRKSELFERRAFNIANATSDGAEELLCDMDLNRLSLLSNNAVYGDFDTSFVDFCKLSKNLVFTIPGSIKITFMPNFESSCLIDSENPSKANLLATYTEFRGIATLPTIELIFTIVPLRWLLIIGKTDLITLTIPKKFVSNCLIILSIDRSSIAPNRPYPALLITTSILFATTITFCIA